MHTRNCRHACACMHTSAHRQCACTCIHTGTQIQTHIHTCMCMTYVPTCYIHTSAHVHTRVCIVCVHNTGTCKICAMLPNFIRGHHKTHVNVSVCVYVRAYQQRWTHPPSPSSAAPALFLGSHVSLREHVKCPMHLWGLPINAPTTCRCGLVSPKARVR